MDVSAYLTAEQLRSLTQKNLHALHMRIYCSYPNIRKAHRKGYINEAEFEDLKKKWKAIFDLVVNEIIRRSRKVKRRKYYLHTMCKVKNIGRVVPTNKRIDISYHAVENTENKYVLELAQVYNYQVQLSID